MAFGFAGSHRTGKTTLAKQVAEDLGMHFHDASVSKIMKEAGINAVGDIPLAQRIEAQEFLLKRYIKDLTFAPRPLITDRTPLDMIGYMLSEVTMHNSTPEIGERIDDYVDLCISSTLELFDTIIVVGPLPAYTADPKSPPPNLAYQRNVQFLIEGAAAQVMAQMYIETLEPTDFQMRRQYSAGLLANRMVQITDESRRMLRH